MKVGIELITGFLGAGKSAFINSLIDQTKGENERVIILTCEDGSTKIKEIEDESIFIKNIRVKDVEDDLNNKIYEVMDKYKPHRIIIEYNGTDSLENFYKNIFSIQNEKLVKLNTIYFICDGKNIEFYIKNMGELLLPFIQNSDVILINNCRSISKDELLKIIKDLEKFNHRAHIIKSHDNEDINRSLLQSGLLEAISIRNMRIKILDYMRK